MDIALVDTDNDGLNDDLEIALGTDPNLADSDNDGIDDFIETNGGVFVDTDTDSTVDALDTDSDNDGIDDIIEGNTDTDNDGTGDWQDDDDDGDGIDTSAEVADGAVYGNDIDMTEGVNWLDTDSDGDGVDDTTEGRIDTDGDGIFAYLDPDEVFDPNADNDGDGIPNGVELTLFTDLNNADSDGDGLCDGVIAVPGVCAAGENAEGGINSDSSGPIDALDFDDDNDGISTAIEVADAAVHGDDVDNDNIPNWLDNDSDNDGLGDDAEGNINDIDNDNIPAYLDSDEGLPTSCDSLCGPDELCDGPNAGIDDDCDGQVDEGCPCTPGTAQSCFKGDPSFLSDPNCFSGNQTCEETGLWGLCRGGVHATENCFAGPGIGCSPISTYPFVTVDLNDGTGLFSTDAITETWEVTCPAGVSPCPTISGSNPTDDFTPLQSGEYTVTYTKTTAAGTDSCTYPLFVGATGLRVELEWEWEVGLGSSTVDLDLHLHEPNNTSPWGIASGNAVDCAWDNCVLSDFQSGTGVSWFTGTAPPEAVSWFLNPIFEANTCYFAPRGAGAGWQSLGQGCHSPRLDIDNITCDPSITDPQSATFCNPENINVDYPPLYEWTRVAVYYYSNRSQTYDVHPNIKIYCDGGLAAELGSQGFNNVVTFTPADGTGDNTAWLAADVIFVEDECGRRSCIVEPLFGDASQQTPYFTTEPGASADFGPAYPPTPSAP